MISYQTLGYLCGLFVGFLVGYIFAFFYPRAALRKILRQMEKLRKDAGELQCNLTRLATPGHCHDCLALPGELHKIGCDVEECPFCHGQLEFCDCPNQHFFGNKTSEYVAGEFPDDFSEEQRKEWLAILQKKGRIPLGNETS